MSITKKIGAVLLIVFAALMCGAWLVLQTSVQSRFEQQALAAHELDRARVEANLTVVAEAMRSRVLDYARWDDTYRYFQGAYPGYVDDNFSAPGWLSSYGADLAILLDNQGRPLWSRQVTDTGETSADADVSRAIYMQARGLTGDASWTGAIWTEAAGPMIFAAARATRTDGSGQPLGYVIIARRLDTGALAQQTQLDIQFTAEPQPHSFWRGDDGLHSLIPLTSARGQTYVGGVIARSGPAISQLGAQTVIITTVLLAFILAIGLCALWLALRHVVIGRLESMERHFHAQRDAIAPMTAENNGDEISRLIEAYNEFTRRIAEADARARAALLEGEAAAASNRMKSDFLANISYELRTPLNDVLGYADLIREDLHDRGDTKADSDIARITSAARNMMSLLVELLDLSRIEAERLEIVAEPFEAEETMLSAVAAVKSSAEAHNATLKVYATSDLGPACTDQNRVRQCLVNILTHASRRSQGGGLSLRADRIARNSGDLLRFEIADSGHTLTDAQIAGLFEPFLREDDERLSGARLGLAVTRKLAQLLGGSFEVYRRTIGCAYVLTIPANFGDELRPAITTEGRLKQKPAFAA